MLALFGFDATSVPLVRSMLAEGSLPALERLAEQRGLVAYVLRAQRLDGDLWEVQAAPL